MGQGRDIQRSTLQKPLLAATGLAGIRPISDLSVDMETGLGICGICHMSPPCIQPLTCPRTSCLAPQTVPAHPHCYKIEPFPFTDNLKTPCSLHPKTHGRCTTDRPHCLSRCPNLQKPVMPHSMRYPLPLADRSLVWTSPTFGRISANIGSLRCPLYVLLSP